MSGIRAVPSLGYLTTTPPFSIGPESTNDTEPKDRIRGAPPPASTGPLSGVAGNTPKAKLAAAAQVPQGGFFRDGRANTLEEQSSILLLSPFEMDNATPGILLRKLMRAPYAKMFTELFGADIFGDKIRAMSEAAFALARYELENRQFHPFTSKYDDYLRGQAKLSHVEARGLQLFDDPKKGNCSACHLDKITPDGRLPAFTDFEFEGLGAPRNPAIAANKNPLFFDLGICGPLRSDAYAKQPANCALFKTPTLRNVATRHVFFHNGAFRTLRDVLHFYVERDTNPEKWYPRRANGTIDKYNDVPVQYRANLDVIDAPFDRDPSKRPALNDREIADIIAFLGTLTDNRGPAARQRAGSSRRQ